MRHRKTKPKVRLLEIILIFVLFSFAALANALANPSFKDRVTTEVAKALNEIRPISVDVADVAEASIPIGD